MKSMMVHKNNYFFDRGGLSSEKITRNTILQSLGKYLYAIAGFIGQLQFYFIAVRLNSTTIKLVCSTADFPRSSIFFSFPSPPNQKVMDLEVTPRRISTPFPSPFQDY